MSQEELALLSEMGYLIIQDMSALICESAWWAIYGACFVLAVRALL